MTDLRTDYQKKLDIHREKIKELYTDLRERHPNVAPSRIFEVIAQELNMTLNGVRGMCIRQGLYQPKRMA